MLALRSEIDNIATRTRFNGQSLLNGSLSVTLDAANSDADDVTYSNGGAVTSVSSISVADAQAGETYTFSASGAVLTLEHDHGKGYVRTETATVQAMGASGTQDVIFEELGVTLSLEHDAVAANHTGANIANAFDTTVVVTDGNGNASFRVGSEVGDDITLAFTDMRSSALGINGSELDVLIADNSAVSTVAEADTLLDSVDEAIDQVSTFRAKVGARQNQLEAATNSLGASIENLMASESRIRDADIAELSSQMITKQIIQQAGVSVLAQANSAPQAVLSLLR